jgi:hypothetical protein
MLRGSNSFRGFGTLLGLANLIVITLSKDFRLLGGGATYLVVSTILCLFLFSPLKIDRASPGVGLPPEQLKLVAALATGFTVMGTMAPFCHGASFHFAKAVPFTLTVIFLASLYPLIVRAEELTKLCHNGQGGYFTKALSLRLVFWGVAVVAEILYLLFSMEAGRGRVNVIEVANVGVAVLMIVTFVTLRLTGSTARIKSAGKSLLIGWCILVAVTTLMVLFGELTTKRGVYFACLSLFTGIALTASALSVWSAGVTDQPR